MVVEWPVRVDFPQGFSARPLAAPPIPLGPAKDFPKFDSKFAGARSAQKFPHNLLLPPKFASYSESETLLNTYTCLLQGLSRPVGDLIYMRKHR